MLRALQAARTMAGLTRQQLADAAAVHHARLGRIERGESAPRAEEIERLTRALKKAASQPRGRRR